MARMTFVALGLAGAVWASAAGDVVLLKSGARLEGKVVAEDEESLIVRVGDSEISVPRENVKEVVEQQTADELYHKMLEGLDEKDPEGHYQIALYCAKEGLTDEAVELLRRALDLKPHYPQAMRELKRIIEPEARELFERAGKSATPAKARECYGRLVEKYPESVLAAEAQAAIAESHFAQHNYAAAMVQWKTILEDDPQNTRAYLGAVQICEEIGEFERALEILDGVLAYEIDEAVRKQCSDKKGTIREIVAAREAIEQDPDNPQNYARLAAQLEKIGKKRQAAKRMMQAVERGSRDLELVEKLARHHDDDLRVTKALDYWSLLKTLRPDGRLLREADSRVAQLLKLKLIPEYLQCSSPDRREEIILELERAGLPFDLVEKVIRRWLEFPEAQTTGVVTRSLERPDGTAASYGLLIPENYDPEIRWPLIVALHGAGGTGDRYVFTWAKHAQEHGYLVLAPTGDERTGWRASGRYIVQDALGEVRDDFNIDTNRIFIDGASMGAGGAWEFALHMPGRFAGLVSRAGGLRPLVQLFLPNGAGLPVYIVHGLKDEIVPVDSVKAARKALERLGGDVEFRLYPRARHSTFDGETPRIMRWMSGRSRDPYPNEVRFTLRDLGYPQSFWLQAEVLTDDVFDPSRPVTVPTIAGQTMDDEMRMNYLLSVARKGMALLKGKIEGNIIKVRTRHIIGYTVLLDDRMMDLDEPIEIYTNGKRSFFGKAERSLPFMLEWARRHRDPEMIFSAYARVVVTAE